LSGGGAGLFYFAGHGVQIRGRNFLMPVGVDIKREDEVPYKAVDVQMVLDKMQTAKNRINVVVLDACRDNPFARSTRSTAGGLGSMDAPIGSLVAFATAPGAVASDGKGANGLYTQHLLANIDKPGLPIEEVFKRVRLGVRLDSNGEQVPWENTSLEGDFYFFPPSAAGPRRRQPAGAAARHRAHRAGGARLRVAAPAPDRGRRPHLPGPGREQPPRGGADGPRRPGRGDAGAWPVAGGAEDRQRDHRQLAHAQRRLPHTRPGPGQRRRQRGGTGSPCSRLPHRRRRPTSPGRSRRPWWRWATPSAPRIRGRPPPATNVPRGKTASRWRPCPTWPWP
jgi:hypothetical protein